VLVPSICRWSMAGQARRQGLGGSSRQRCVPRVEQRGPGKETSQPRCDRKGRRSGREDTWLSQREELRRGRPGLALGLARAEEVAQDKGR